MAPTALDSSHHRTARPPARGQVLSWLSFGDSIPAKLASQARLLAFFYVVRACAWRLL